jgi:periplasmic copper chaperone A
VRNPLPAPRTFARRGLLLGTFALTCAIAVAATYEHGALRISQPWSRATSPGMPMGVAYLTITNRGRNADALIAASTPAAARVEFHRTTFEAGMAQMRPSRAVVVEPNATITAEPGSLHLMLVDLKSPLVVGTMVPLVLRFETAGEITVQLQVEPMGSTPHR